MCIVCHMLPVVYIPYRISITITVGIYVRLTELSSVARVTGAAEGANTIHTLSIATIHSNTVVINLITVWSSEARPGALCAVWPLEVLSTQHSHA